jgi:hypothetical protein
MKWLKRGRIYETSGRSNWAKTHTLAPAAMLLDKHRIRVFFGFLDGKGVSRIGFVDLVALQPDRVLAVSSKPVLDIGVPGTFDDNGVFPASICRVGNSLRLYYTGFQLGKKVRYYMFAGLAVSRDNGRTFKRVSLAPIMDRSDEGLFFRGGLCTLTEGGVTKMWCSAGSHWSPVGGK